jgi:hypothetical protein
MAARRALLAVALLCAAAAPLARGAAQEDGQVSMGMLGSFSAG